MKARPMTHQHFQSETFLGHGFIGGYYSENSKPHEWQSKGGYVYISLHVIIEKNEHKFTN